MHKHLGPGLLESIYHKCLLHELKLRGLNVESEVRLNLVYKDLIFENSEALRCDLIVESSIVVELKTVECILPVHEATILSYMELAQISKGLLINFKCANISDGGYKSFVNSYYRMLQN